MLVTIASDHVLNATPTRGYANGARTGPPIPMCGNCGSLATLRFPRVNASVKPAKGSCRPRMPATPGAERAYHAQTRGQDQDCGWLRRGEAGRPRHDGVEDKAHIRVTIFGTDQEWRIGRAEGTDQAERQRTAGRHIRGGVETE